MQPNDKTLMLLIMADHHERKGEHAKGLEFREKILRLDPSSENHRKIAATLKRLNRMDPCEHHLRESLGKDPLNVLAIYDMSVVHRIRGRYEQALEGYRRLKELGVDDPKVDSSIGVLHSERGEHLPALRHYEAAYGKDPEDQLIRFNLSLCLLTLGDYRRGLPLYESRMWHCRPPGTEWDGRPTDNLLVIPEQGYGDNIQFSRFLPLLRTRAKRITVLSNRPLVEIMRTASGQDEILEFNPGDEFVEVQEQGAGSVSFLHYARIMSIPHKLGIDPREVPFEQNLKAQPEKAREWAGRLPPRKRPRIGLCWQGGRRNEPETDSIDDRRSIPPELLHPVLRADADFFSLQNQPDRKRPPGVHDLMDHARDFTDTAALIENLDLVITVDTAVAHLSATLGKPTWTLLRKGGCWRWGTHGESTPWYPSMRLFRQENAGDWKETIKGIAEELAKNN